MPTGYTAKLMESGQTFPEFAMLCARAFGALVELRDHDMDAPIPEQLPLSDYHVKALASANEELARLDAMTGPEREAFGQSQKESTISNTLKHLSRESEENRRIEEMVNSVTAWIPPSGEHEEMKKFMLEQLEISKYRPYYEEKLAELNLKSALSFWDGARSGAARSVQYHTEEQREAADRNASRNNWIKLLRDSLKSE